MTIYLSLGFLQPDTEIYLVYVAYLQGDPPGSTSEGVGKVLKEVGVLTGYVTELVTSAGNCSVLLGTSEVSCRTCLRTVPPEMEKL